MDPELSEADMEAINKLIDEVEKSNKQWKMREESRRIEAANKAASMDDKFDRIIALLEKMMPTPKSESESELCVPVETDMVSKGTVHAVEIDEDSSEPELESKAAEFYSGAVKVDAMVESVGSASAEIDLASIDVTDKSDSAIATGVFENGDLDVSTQTKAYLSPVYVDRSSDDDQVSLDLVLLSDSALVEIMPKSKQTLMSAKTDMESFVAVFDYKTKHMTVNESESLLALINSENLCVKHVRQYASEYILPVEVELSLLCWLQLWKGIKGVQRCLYVKLVDGNYVYDKGKSEMYDNEWYEVVVKENMKVKRDAVTYNSLLVALNKYELLSYSLPNQRPPSLPPENDLKINVSDDVVAELENGVDSLFESFARFHSHMLSVGQNAGKIRGHAEIIQVMLKQVSDVLLQWAADETRHINPTDVGIHLSLLVYIPRISVSNSVADDPELWVHESAGLLRPVFRFLEIDQAAWHGLEETAGSATAKSHVRPFLRLLAEDNDALSAEFSYQDISIGLEESVKECRAFTIETMVQLGDVMMEYEALLSCYHMHLPMLLCEQFYKKRKIFVPLDLAHMNRKDPIRNEFLLLELDKVLENYSNFPIQRNVDNDRNVLDETQNLLGQVIGGLDKLVMNMKKGGVALVTIAPENAFGYVESQHDMIAVPSNSVLFYEDELGSFDKKQTSYDMNMKETIQVAGQDEDNVLFNVRKYARTSKRHEKAAEYTEPNTFFVEEVKKKQVEKLCTKNLDVESTNVIAQYRRDDAYLVRFANNIFMFSVPRPPEEVEFDHEINLEAKEVKAMPLGHAYVANKVLHLMNNCNQATLKCVEVANLEDKVFPKDGGMMRIGNLEGEVVF